MKIRTQWTRPAVPVKRVCETVVVTDVIDSDIPLLLSKPDMKRLGFKLNLADDTLEVNGKKLDLDTTTSGHYYIPLKTCELPLESVNMFIENKSHGEKQKMIVKLHQQFNTFSV